MTSPRLQLTIVRHGAADRGSDASLHDDGRVLTAGGRDAVRATAAALAGRGVAPSHILTSPLARAVQTAELLAGGLGYSDVIDALGCLEPDGSLGEVLTRLDELGALRSADRSVDVLLASHEPQCSRLSSLLGSVMLHGVSTATAVRLDVRRADSGGATILWRWDSPSGRFIEG